MPSTTSAGRATVSDVELRMSLVSTKVKAYNVVNRSDEREVHFELLCPVCKSAHLDQLYHCQAGCLPDDDHPAERPQGWKIGEVPTRGRWEGETLVATATTEELEATKKAAREDTGVDEKTLDLAFYPAEQVEATMAQSGNTYCLLPDKNKDADAFYQMLLVKAADPTIAIVAAFVVKSAVNIYRLTASPGGLLLHEMRRPEESHTFSLSVGKPPTEKEQAMFDGLVGVLTDDLDPEAYTNGRTAALKNMIAAKTGVDTSNIVPIKSAGKAKAEDDMTAVLEAALAAAAAAKAAKKSA